jgi:hypothetical protein
MLIDDPVSDLEHSCTPTERRNVRRYQLELLGSLLVYAALLFVSVANVDRLAGTAKVAVAILPMLGFAAMTVAIVRFVMKTDEFQRQSFVTAGAIAAVAGAVVTMLLGFLENAGVPRISMTWVWPIDCAAFGIALVMLRRRYR